MYIVYSIYMHRVASFFMFSLVLKWRTCALYGYSSSIKWCKNLRVVERKCPLIPNFVTNGSRFPEHYAEFSSCRTFFSSASNILSSKRFSMTYDTLRAHLCTHSWMNSLLKSKICETPFWIYIFQTIEYFIGGYGCPIICLSWGYNIRGFTWD